MKTWESVDKWTNQALDGVNDMSFSNLRTLLPGGYVVVPNATDSPEPGSYGNLIIWPMSSSNRIAAIIAFDSGNIFIGKGYYENSSVNAWEWKNIVTSYNNWQRLNLAYSSDNTLNITLDGIYKGYIPVTT